MRKESRGQGDFIKAGVENLVPMTTEKRTGLVDLEGVSKLLIL